LIITIDAPFYNDPVVPENVSTELPVDGLWDYEVVEVFFLGENDEYLEIEVAPSAHYLMLYLAGVRNATNQTLPLPYPVLTVQYPREDPNRWAGQILVPKEYFPCGVSKFNAYAIHKSDPNRNYMSLFPVPTGAYPEPDFHRLEYFEAIQFPEVNPRCFIPEEDKENGDNNGTNSVSTLLSVVVLSTIMKFLF